jgi:hypothetical protein
MHSPSVHSSRWTNHVARVSQLGGFVHACFLSDGRYPIRHDDHDDPSELMLGLCGEKPERERERLCT